MATYSMTCSCGEVMSAEANSRDDAVKTIQDYLNEASLAEHMKQFHKADEPTPTVEQAHAMVSQLVTAG